MTMTFLMWHWLIFFLSLFRSRWSRILYHDDVFSCLSLVSLLPGIPPGEWSPASHRKQPADGSPGLQTSKMRHSSSRVDQGSRWEGMNIPNLVDWQVQISSLFCLLILLILFTCDYLSDMFIFWKLRPKIWVLKRYHWGCVFCHKKHPEIQSSS